MSIVCCSSLYSTLIYSTLRCPALHFNLLVERAPPSECPVMKSRFLLPPWRTLGLWFIVLSTDRRLAFLLWSLACSSVLLLSVSPKSGTTAFSPLASVRSLLTRLIIQLSACTKRFCDRKSTCSPSHRLSTGSRTWCDKLWVKNFRIWSIAFIVVQMVLEMDVPLSSMLTVDPSLRSAELLAVALDDFRFIMGSPIASQKPLCTLPI